MVFCQLSHILRKPAFCICENKGADQLHVNCAADQCLFFHYIDYKIVQPLASLCGCTARFVSDLVRNAEDRFSHDAAQLYFR